MPDGAIDPCHRPLYDIAMLSPNEGWMVGDRGAIFYWNGTEWQEQATPIATQLSTVVALNSQNVWAAGDQYDGNNDILHWDGNGWAAYPIPTSMPYQWVMDLSFANENDGWAVVQEYDDLGNGVNYLSHWDGAAWVRSNDIDRLQAVYMLSADDGWASSEFGGFYHWNGEAWQQADENMLDEGVFGFGHGPHHIFFPSVDEGWIIGSSGETVHWNGNKWQANQEPLPILNVMDTAVFNHQVWVSGFDGNTTNLLFHWDGQSWSPITAPPEVQISGLSVVSENDIWAVGHDIFQNYPLIWHWDGTTWTPYHTIPQSPPILAFAMVSENEAWGVGENGYIGFWDGQEWNEFPSLTANNLNGVDFIAPDNGWAVGDHSTMLHWDGESWSLIKQSEDTDYYTLELQDIAFISATEIWAAGGVNSEGGGGPLLIHLQWDGQVWQDLEPNTPYCECYFYGIAMLSGTDGWAVGGGYGAATVHWDGTTWQEVPNPGNYWFYSVVALAPDEVWADGIQNQSSDTIPMTVHWNGQEWVEVNSLVTPDPLPSMPTSEEWLKGKWILDDFYWNGTSWVPIHNLTTQRIIAADMTPSGQIVVLTDGGTWLRLNE